jgi:hypothetical protein
VSEPTPIEVARFPRATAMLKMVATADVLRAAADELDALAGDAHRFDIGTLRRQARAIVFAVVALLHSGEA